MQNQPGLKQVGDKRAPASHFLIEDQSAFGTRGDPMAMPLLYGTAIYALSASPLANDLKCVDDKEEKAMNC